MQKYSRQKIKAIEDHIEYMVSRGQRGRRATKSDNIAMIDLIIEAKERDAKPAVVIKVGAPTAAGIIERITSDGAKNVFLFDSAIFAPIGWDDLRAINTVGTVPIFFLDKASSEAEADSLYEALAVQLGKVKK